MKAKLGSIIRCINTEAGLLRDECTSATDYSSQVLLDRLEYFLIGIRTAKGIIALEPVDEEVVYTVPAVWFKYLENKDQEFDYPIYKENTHWRIVAEFIDLHTYRIIQSYESAFPCSMTKMPSFEGHTDSRVWEDWKQTS